MIFIIYDQQKLRQFPTTDLVLGRVLAADILEARDLLIREYGLSDPCLVEYFQPCVTDGDRELADRMVVYL